MITGVGAVTPLGAGAPALVDRWLAGESGIEDGLARCSDFEPTETLSRKEARRMDRFTQFAVVAADDVALGVLDRGRHAIAYAKGLDSIESVLSAAGAGDTVLAFEERSIVAAARGEANRLANEDHANLVRTSRAAQAQLEAVRALQREGGLERLPDRLHEVALLRLRYPTLPLRELAAKCEPATTKASVHRRLRKLQEYVGDRQ